jgi:hypothetical protein
MELVRLIKICLNETHSKVCKSKHLSDTFPIQNVLKQEGALLPFLFKFILEYTIMNIRESGLEIEWAASAFDLS